MKDSTSPLFSIIVANYNNGRFLNECIESIKAQTYNNWEIILVDDASTDDISLKLYELYKDDSRIKILYNEINKGVGYTKRRAIDNANGEFCGIVDPDDKIIPETLELVVKEFYKHPNAAIVHTNHFICDEHLNITQISTNSGAIPEHESQLSFDGPKIGPFWAFRKEKYLLTSGIDPMLRRAEDQDILYKLEEIGHVVFVNIPTYYYRYHSQGLSTINSFLKAIYWNLLVCETAYKRRKLNKDIATPNITRRELDKRWLNYYNSKMIEKAKLKQYPKVAYLFFKSLKYIFSDHRLLTFRIFANSILRKY